MKSPINPVIEPIVREFKATLQTLYGDCLRDVVLYGSYARGDYDEESDIDLMVLLNDDKVNTYAEIRRIAEVETAFLLKFGLVISPFPVAYKKYSVSYRGVYQEARKDGLIV
ncbi:nucleotidyltransferase domain-containing protein [Spirosoma spitsbergense]|uniref:nucleotidyltransferase domain-containing protein n=1 Tax=Spirosoma spitsbergense TaxID=431554 RepID=UPI0003A6D06E|nr:nucleotidyltransferase domain-containing protein [Spirosoma spitsbergense]